MRRSLLVAALSILVVGCNKEEPAPEEPAKAEDAGAPVTDAAVAGAPDAAPSGATAALLQKVKEEGKAPADGEPAAEKPAKQDTGNPKWFACKKPKDCVADQDMCKEPVALNKKFKKDYRAWVKGQKGVKCEGGKKKKAAKKPKLACQQSVCQIAKGK